MMTFAHIDPQGYPVSGGRHHVMPEGAILLPEPWVLTDLARLRYLDGSWSERDDLDPPEVSAPTPEELALWQAAILARAKRMATDRINQHAGEVRSRFVTVIPGQEMIYLIKEAEARSFLADPAPVLADYPFVSAEIGITGANAGQVAQVYVNLAAVLRATAAQLETARLGTIAAVEAATDPAGIEAAVAAYEAALEAFG
jgi:hypothetical protein